MAYDERLAQRVRVILGPGDHISERKMFGGLAFMLNGNMCCCVDMSKPGGAHRAGPVRGGTGPAPRPRV